MGHALSIIMTAVLAYLWGSLNSAITVIRFLKKEDVRQKGSGNAGLTNVLRVYGKKAALITLLCDLFKGVIAVAAARLIVGGIFDIYFFNDKYFIGYVAGFFAMLGHIFPLYYNFRGGKGVLIAATTLIAIDPVTCVLSLAIFVAVLAVSKYVSLSSIIACGCNPFLTIITQSIRGIDGRAANFLMALLIAALIIYMHRSNISRLRNGTENKFSFKNSKS